MAAPKKTNTNYQNILLFVGCFFLLVGVICNKWVLNFHRNEVDLIFVVFLWTAQIAAIIIGSLLIIYRKSISSFKNLLFNVLLLVASIFVSFFAAEIILRIVGRTPWQINQNTITVEPGGKLFSKHPKLGYVQRPGKYKITLADGYSFIATHDATGFRITQPLSSYNSEEEKKEIWIFGDSMNYGWSLNDDEVYPWFLQEKLPKYKVVNFGVNGYGTLQSLIQFKEALQSGNKPAIAVINYGSFHDRRNTLLRERKKLIAGPWNSIGLMTQPYARFKDDNKLKYQFTSTEYIEIPLIKVSALVNFIERVVNNFEEKINRSHDVTKEIIKDFSELAKENDVKLVLAGIWWDPLTKSMIDYCSDENILAVDISIDLDQPGKRNYPHDDHPVSEVHMDYCNMLLDYFNTNKLVE
jgi:hypothetical protein